ncbi:hypothetical protein ACHWGL_32290, partial [Klebsiella pneumoniae]|uniref:hypothetical protein n=1 Tax=Klebsiella pneumoniae TaxID=573 RepID=UPI00376F3594
QIDTLLKAVSPIRSIANVVKVGSAGYALRGGDWGLLDRMLVRVAEAAAGDVLLMAAGPGQIHLGIRTAGGFVHADAGLRRVV